MTIIQYIRNFFGHLGTILKHKYYVGKYCFKAGLYLQGITHDLSKFHPVEFFESVRWYDGHISPIDKCKKAKGYSNAWFHHRGRNKHHYEFWCDNFEKGITCVDMPYKYALEMLCDYIGDGRAYMGGKFSFSKEYEWWSKTKQPVAKMSDNTKQFIDSCLFSLAQLEERWPDEIDNFWKNKTYKTIWNITNKQQKNG